MLEDSVVFGHKGRAETVVAHRSALTTMRKDRTMADRADITPALMRQLLRYEAGTGKLFWRERNASIIPDLRLRCSWNGQYAGQEAGHINNKGYRTVDVLATNMRAHRVVWAIVHGVFPKGIIDHINGVRDDNRIANLRDVSTQESAKNRGRQKNNPSGCVGVAPRDGRWRVMIGTNGKRINLGTFSTFEDAVRARKTAEKKFGFHPNHGLSVR